MRDAACFFLLLQLIDIFSKVHCHDAGFSHSGLEGAESLRKFAPFALHPTYTGHHDDVLSIQWSPDSTYVFSVGPFRYRMTKLVDTQMLHHYIEGHDGSSLYSGPS